MITRRGFIIAGGGALTTLALASAGPAMAAFGKDMVSVASLGRPLAPAMQGSSHIVLTGEPTADLRTLERVLQNASTADLRLSLDAADQVLFEVAQTRSATRLVPVASQASVQDLRFPSRAGA